MVKEDVEECHAELRECRAAGRCYKCCHLVAARKSSSVTALPGTGNDETIKMHRNNTVDEHKVLMNTKKEYVSLSGGQQERESRGGSVARMRPERGPFPVDAPNVLP